MLTGTKVAIVLQKPQPYCQFLKKICYFCQLKENGPNQALKCKIIHKQYPFMKVLKDRILKDGKCYPGGILKVDKFINHQMDPNLMKDIAVEFIRRFAGTKVNKILTIEASGIAPAIMMGFLMNLPVVFAKKKKPNTMDNMLATKVTSFTKQREYDVIISRDYLTADDHVLFIDDFLANGNAAKGIIDLCQQAGATLEGMGFIIEKAFQDGGKFLRDSGIRVESLAIIESLDNCEIKLHEQ